MKETIKKTLCGVGLCAAAAGSLLYFEHHAKAPYLPVSAPSTAESASAEPESTSLPETADEKVELLIRGAESMSSAELEQLCAEIAAQEEADETQEETSAGSEAPAAAASSSPETAASSDSGASQAPAASVVSSSPQQQDSCDAQIEALVAQLYQQQDRYERELLEIIRQAHQEYVAYPEDQRSLLLKVQVVLGKRSALTALEKDCDAEVDSICSQMATILKANGRDTAAVQEVKKVYTDKKSELKQELIHQTYSGGDGSGSAGHWLYDRLE